MAAPAAASMPAATSAASELIRRPSCKEKAIPVPISATSESVVTPMSARASHFGSVRRAVAAFLDIAVQQKSGGESKRDIDQKCRVGGSPIEGYAGYSVKCEREEWGIAPNA